MALPLVLGHSDATQTPSGRKSRNIIGALLTLGADSSRAFDYENGEDKCAVRIDEVADGGSDNLPPLFPTKGRHGPFRNENSGFTPNPARLSTRGVVCRKTELPPMAPTAERGDVFRPQCNGA
jgi:hypothetical protein